MSTAATAARATGMTASALDAQRYPARRYFAIRFQFDSNTVSRQRQIKKRKFYERVCS